jgi:SAM-dependent methyltransferase
VESEQYEVMANAEDVHWWYLGLRDAIASCLSREDLQLPESPAILDAGCGTGANLRFLAEAFHPGYLAGFDASELALGHARRKCPEAEIYQSDVCRPVLPRAQFQLIVSCDVLYVPGLEAARNGLHSLAEALAPGGLLLLNLPAYQWLKSAHDRAVHTSERYVLKQIRRLLADLDLQPVRLSYRVCLLFPLVVMRRLPSMVWRSRARTSTDLAQPPGWLNRCLLSTLRFENRLIAKGTKLPWGTSIFAIARKR